MTTFLVGISILLNILALFAIVVLFLRQNRLIQVEQKQEKLITEMEEIISNYLVQMKEENEDFINRIKKIDAEPKRTEARVDNGGEMKGVNPNPQSNETGLNIRTGKVHVHKAVHAYKQNVRAANTQPLEEESIELPPLENRIEKTTHSPLSEEKNNDINRNETIGRLEEQSLLSQVLNLRKQGLSEELIARKLNKGKTEIALLLKFNQNK
ncbi:hypothetical protein KDN24_22575 [Bacillus sp. Bva_UNVM-123]|uniref:hypothetical protein n=1 Tax=Bacillus sp. Bva_UNVM-123 TaxID=2829798 RepID=UPI00391F029D